MSAVKWLEKAVDHKKRTDGMKRELVKRACDVAALARMERNRGGRAEANSHSQLRNLLEYARSGALVEELTLFIDYQVKRNKLSPEFAKGLKGAIEEVAKNDPELAGESIPLFFGYLCRLMRTEEDERGGEDA
jgi:hypothetical protein